MYTILEVIKLYLFSVIHLYLLIVLGIAPSQSYASGKNPLQACASKIKNSLLSKRYNFKKSFPFRSLTLEANKNDNYDEVMIQVRAFLEQNHTAYYLRNETIRNTKLHVYKSVGKYSDIPLGASDRFRPIRLQSDRTHKVMIDRFYKFEPRFQKAYLEAYNRLNDAEAFKMYMSDLYTEAFYWQLANNRNGRFTLEIKSGKLSFQAMKVALIQRFKAREDKRFSVIKKGLEVKGVKDTNMEELSGKKRFQNVIRYGPFIDRSFKDFSSVGHGSFSHLIQRDYVHKVIEKNYGGEYNKFYETLGSPRGITYWIDLFDSGVLGTLNRPESLTKEVYDMVFE